VPAVDTFVVRIYQSGQAEAGARGVVDDVASGFRSTFRDAEELLLILLRSDKRRYPEDRSARDE
jgi:hypothetical protein